jgi:hypothetical protein
MKQEIYICDIKGCKNTSKTSEISQTTIQCIRTTDMTEGRPCNRYLDRENIDICKKCYDKILHGAYVIAYGAQGYNTFELHEHYKK